MKRREFITLLGGTAAAWPFAVRAQRSSPPVIGFLSGRSFSESRSLVAAFGNGLREAGVAEGQNASIEFKWADGQYDNLPGQAAELVRRPVALIVAVGAVPAIRAAKAYDNMFRLAVLDGIVHRFESDLVKLLGQIPILNHKWPRAFNMAGDLKQSLHGGGPLSKGLHQAVGFRDRRHQTSSQLAGLANRFIDQGDDVGCVGGFRQ